MKEYHKIETLWQFDMKTKKFISGSFHNETVEVLKNHQWIFTEKIDGMNFRLHWDGHKLSVGGRTENTQLSQLMLDYINTNLLTDAMTNAFESLFAEKIVTFYGELYGATIQKGGGLYSSTIAFKVFDIEIDDVFLVYSNAKGLAEQFGLEFVPICLIGTIQDGVDYVNTNTTSTFSKATLEGVVGKPLGDLRDRLGKRIVIKIKKRDL